MASKLHRALYLYGSLQSRAKCQVEFWGVIFKGVLLSRGCYYSASMVYLAVLAILMFMYWTSNHNISLKGTTLILHRKVSAYHNRCKSLIQCNFESIIIMHVHLHVDPRLHCCDDAMSLETWRSLTWSWRKRCLAWSMMCSSTTTLLSRAGLGMVVAASPTTIIASTTSWRYSGSVRELRTPSTSRANLSSPAVICREKWRWES